MEGETGGGIMSDRGCLSQCLVDGDAEVVERARRLRQKALVLSILFEALLIAAMLFWPLITPGVLPRPYVITPAPPYPGGGNSNALHPHAGAHPPAGKSYRPDVAIFLQPPVIPPRTPDSNNGEAPSIGLDSDSRGGDASIPGATGSEPIVPGGTGGRPFLLAPAPTGHHAEPHRMSEGIMQASLIYRVQPEYPRAAQVMHLSGTVRLRAIISRDGTVRQLEVLSGNLILVQSAVAAVREWRYQPTRLNGEAVEVETYITVNFILE
jgi:TonB family protein